MFNFIYLTVLGLSCSIWILRCSIGIQFPKQESNPGPLLWEGGALATRPPSSCLVASATSYSVRPHGLQPARLLCPCDSLGKSIRVGFQAPLQGIFLTQGSNLGLAYCRQLLYCWAKEVPPKFKKQSNHEFLILKIYWCYLALGEKSRKFMSWIVQCQITHQDDSLTATRKFRRTRSLSRIAVQSLQAPEVSMLFHSCSVCFTAHPKGDQLSNVVWAWITAFGFIINTQSQLRSKTCNFLRLFI